MATQAEFERKQSSIQDKTFAIFIGLVLFRLINALSIQTFFQPDEYFQSLEPAWKSAFGENSGAWITWVRFSQRTEWQEYLQND